VIQANLCGILQLRFEQTQERADLDEAVRLDEILTGLLGWLWTTVASPVLDALNLTGRLDLTDPDAARGRRLWWCPTGLLSFLPLHAAGRYDRELEAVPERVIPPTPQRSACSSTRGNDARQARADHFRSACPTLPARRGCRASRPRSSGPGRYLPRSAGWASPPSLRARMPSVAECSAKWRRTTGCTLRATDSRMSTIRLPDRLSCPMARSPSWISQTSS